MTEEEILRHAEEIKARRERAARGREVMQAARVEIVAWYNDHPQNVRIPVPTDANLAAFLCRVLDCNITEGETNG